MGLYSILGLFGIFLVAILVVNILYDGWFKVRRWIGLDCSHYDIDSFTLIHSISKKK